jgi:hypothetical protein
MNTKLHATVSFLPDLVYCCWSSPAQALLFFSLTGFMTIFYCLAALVDCGFLSYFVTFCYHSLRTHYRHFSNTIGTTDTIKHMNIAYTLPLYSQWLYFAWVNGENNWTGLETIHVTATLTNFLELFLQEEKLLTLQFFIIAFGEAG